VSAFAPSIELARDPIFGAPLSPPERRLWEHLLLPRRKRKTWPEHFWMFLRRATSPFGPGSGGAGGSLTSAELGGTAAAKPQGTDWPVWLYPTPDFQNFDKFGATTLLAGPTTGTIGDGVFANGNSMPWTVLKGYNGFIKTIAIEEIEGEWVPGFLPLALTFALTVNAVAPPDYGLIAYSPGLVVAPAPIAGVPIKSLNVVKITYNNISVTPGEGGDGLRARLQGYYYGQHYEPKGVAF